jgi:hypothetical protein
MLRFFFFILLNMMLVITRNINGTIVIVNLVYKFIDEYSMVYYLIVKLQTLLLHVKIQIS